MAPRDSLKGMVRGMKWLALAIVLPLAACNAASGGDGPSEKDITDALTRSGMTVKSAERIACKTAPDRPGYVCDFKVTTCNKFKPSDCSKSATRTGRFVLFGDNWMFRDDVADPNRYAPKPDSGDANGNTVVADLNPTPTPTASPTPAATPSPTPTPTPKPSPSATPTPKPTPTPTTAAIPPGVNKAWLVGRWSDGPGNCAARKAVNFGPGGGFYGKRGLGRWSLSGKTVVVKGNYSADNKPFDQSLKVERTGDNSMTIEGKRYQRCDN